MLPRLYTLLASLAPFAAAALPATNSTAIVPRVMIVSMVRLFCYTTTRTVRLIQTQFEPESQIWFDRFNTSGLGDIANTSVPVVGMSMLFPHVYCTASREICQVTVGEGEINAAASTIALILSSKFDLRSTYWLLGGIGGVNPERATLGSVGFARYAVQVALQYEIDGRDVPEDWVTGYIPYGQKDPRGYPTITYGTEVFELNANLRDLAVKYASQATLEDQSGPQAYRAKYKDVPSFKTGAQPPAIVKCDIATSDVYYTGHRLAQAFDQTIDIWTNGTGEYCMSAQEDNAVLEGLVRGAVEGLVDFSRVIVYRVGKFARYETQIHAPR